MAIVDLKQSAHTRKPVVKKKKKKRKPMVREAREWGREKHTVPEK